MTQYDTWEETAADRDQRRCMLWIAMLVTEEERKQEYLRAPDGRLSVATSDEFECSICDGTAGPEWESRPT